jgi:transcriptional regulator with GAF, ATPase, and Fis domain/tetratricopeptide (TPR) repeat protein
VLALEDLEEARGAARDALVTLCRRAWVARRAEAEARGPLDEPERPPAPRLLVLATADEVAALPAPLRALLAEPFARGCALEPLPARDLPRLAATVLGGAPCPDALQERLALFARGLPGRVARVVADFVAGVPPDQGLVREPSLVDDALRRLGEADPGTQALARALAVLGRPAPAPLLAAACGVDPMAAGERLRLLVRAGVVVACAGSAASSAPLVSRGRQGSSGRSRRPSVEALRAAAARPAGGGGVRWTLAHTALRRAILRALEAPGRAAIAAALERALAARPEGERGAVEGDLAARLERCELLAAAEDGARLRRVAPPVVALLEARGAFDALADLLRALGRLEPAAGAPEDRHEHRRREAEARFRAGQGDRAARLLRRLIDSGLGTWPRAVEAALWRRLAEHHAAAGEDAEARPALARARASLDAARDAQRDADRSDMTPAALAVERARLAAVAAEVHLGTGELADAGAACDEGLDALKVEGIPPEEALPARARLLGLLGQLSYREDDLGKAEQMLRAGLALFERLKLGREAAQALHRLGTVAFARGHVSQAEVQWRAALARAEGVRDDRAAAAARSSLALAAARRGALAEARELLRSSLLQRQELGDAQGCAASLHNLGFVYTCAGALEEAAAAYRESLTLRRDLNDRWYAAAASNNLGHVLTELGRTSEARAHLDEALAARVEMGDRRGEAASLAYLSELDLRACDFAAARARAAQAQRIREETADPEDLIDSARRTAKIHMALGGLLEAQRAVERAIGFLSDSATDTWHDRDPDRARGEDGPDRGGASPLQEAACRLLLGEVLVRRGALDRGKRELERARRAAEAVGDRLAARAAAIELAALQLAKNKPDDARFLLDSRPVPQPGRLRPLEGREPPDRHGVLRVRERLLRARIELARPKGSVFVAARSAEEALEEARRASLRDLEWRALQVLAATAELRGKHEDALALTLETQELVEDLLARVPRERRDGYLAADVLRAAALRGDSPVAALAVRLSVKGGGPETDPAVPPPVLRAMAQTEAGAPTIEPAQVRKALEAPDVAATPTPGSAAAAPQAGGVNREDFALIVGLTRTIVDEHDVRRAYEAALTAAITLCRAERGFLGTFGDGPDDLTVLAGHGMEDVERPRERFARGCAFKSAETGDLVLSGDVLMDAPVSRHVHRVGLGLRSVLAAPVTSPDGRRAALYLDHPFQLGRFGRREVELLEVLADQCALVVGRDVLEGALHKRRGFSPGLEQRRFFEAKATLERPPIVRFGDPTWGLVGRSSQFRAVASTLEQVAAAPGAILIEGPPGVGKGVVARAVHQQSGRTGPLIVVDLCELAEEHAEVELFGYEAGAFAGAEQARPGLLRQAEGGTLLFERVTEASPEVQAKVIRALEEGSVRPVGASTPVPFDTRVIATGKSVDAAIAAGRLREDLVCLLAMTRVQLAPLDERPEDKGPTIDAILETWGDGAPTLSGPARAALEQRSYPGNVRELKAVLRAAAARARNRPISADDLPAERVAETPTLASAMADFERGYVERALRAQSGDHAAAAKTLGITTRALKKKLEQLGL